MTWKAEVSDSAVQSMTVANTRAHPKVKVKKNFPRFVWRDGCYAPLYTAFASGRTTPKYLAPALRSITVNLIGSHLFAAMYCRFDNDNSQTSTDHVQEFQ